MHESEFLNDEVMHLFEIVCTTCRLECIAPSEFVVDNSFSDDIEDEVMHGDGDVLGLYVPEAVPNDSVRLFREKCRQFAELLKSEYPGDASISAAAVERIVLVHEFSHFVHHRGECPEHPSGGPWDEFKDWPEDECENFAQRTTYLSLKVENPAFATLMAKMSAYQPKRYRISDLQSENEFGDHLCEIRRMDKEGSLGQEGFDG